MLVIIDGILLCLSYSWSNFRKTTIIGMRSEIVTKRLVLFDWR